MRVIIQEAAKRDLDRIHDWIVRDRPRSADTVIDRILASVGRLELLPFMGHIGKVPGTYEWVVPRSPYIDVYQVHIDDDLVAVTAVCHGAQDRERRQEEQ